MSVGGFIVDIVKVSEDRWWVDTADRSTGWAQPGGRKHTVAVYCDPQGHELQVGDGLWWQGNFCYWTPRQKPDGRHDIKIPKLGYSGVTHPDLMHKVKT